MQFTSHDIARFAEWSGDCNPLHVDPKWAAETTFGRTIAHGILSVLTALKAAPPRQGERLRRLDVEFRGAVGAGESFDQTISEEPDGFSVTVTGTDGVLLSIRAVTRAVADAPAADVSWVGTSAPQAQRLEPARRTVQEFERGVDFVGAYACASPFPDHVGTSLAPSEAQLLAFCSYLVGMELPGIRSLFTRITIDFGELPHQLSGVLFRARTTRFDKTFRLLDGRVDIATPDGHALAVASLRSYVPISPSRTDLDELACHVDDAKARLSGKVALVCGSSRGLGADLAAALSLAGCRVYAVSRGDSAVALELRQQLAQRGSHVQFMHGDVGDAHAMARVLDDVRASEGRLDVLVLNACAAPRPMKVTPETAATYEAYVRDNLRLVNVPLAAAIDDLERANGSVVFVSSSFVDEAPVGFGHYVAVKQAGEALVRAVKRERSGVSAVVARPPRLQTTWNDTPTGVAGAIPASRAAVHMVRALAAASEAAGHQLISEFPELVAPATGRSPGPARKACPVRVVGSFTTDPLAPGLDFWSRELGVDFAVEFAPYGQVLQTLLDPGSAFAGRGGLNVVLWRLQDWLHELRPEQADSLDFVRPYVQQVAKELDHALRAHRARAGAETLLLLCPTYGASSSAQRMLLRQMEMDLASGLAGVPGLHIASASDDHARYRVDEDDVHDAVREKLAHIPFKDAYYHVLSAIVARHAYRRVAPVRKVVVVDCDNTLWGGVVGEVGAEGVDIQPMHTALHDKLNALTQSGMLVCLCSKNEEPDVWRVFETRPDLKLARQNVVAAAINWQPKSDNLKSLAARLNLGIDSFIFLDDNPVECAEVRARCPEVLTLQWPTNPEQALLLLNHTWELEAVQATKEDAKRAQMYRDEFKRQEARAGSGDFANFIANLGLTVDVRPLAPEDMRRASQLTLRTNQFNFTTKRREEGDIQALLADGQHEVRTIRVSDRFGDYGLVGLVIAEQQEAALVTDTFLLSCRVLGRGVEHRIASELGKMALARGAQQVKMRVDTTPRNTPARNFLDAIAGVGQAHSDAAGLACEFQAQDLAALAFVPTDGADEVVEDDGGAAPARADVDQNAMRAREAVVAKTAFEWSSVGALASAISGGATPAASAGPPAAAAQDVAAAVYHAFASALRITEARVQSVDSLEALGCDSLKVVEITVSLLEKFPWLPSTLLFEHKTVSGLLREISELQASQNRPRQTPTASVARTAADRSQVETTDIAVVGLHVRCAGANSPDELWNLLSTAQSAVRPVREDRPFFTAPLRDARPHWAGLLDEVDRFDADFFGVAPREAAFVDPQLRLFLEVAWGALEDAGAAGADHDVETGVFVGVMYGDYAAGANAVAKAAGSPFRCWEGFSLANRLSQLLGFRGPSLAIDTACSSSGTAVHLAARALSAGECKVAVVGGVNLILDPDRFGSLGRLGILSARGRCEPFGADADGTVLGEGAGAVVLRPLADAVRRGDRIYGVIKGTGLSTGSGTVGFTAPNPIAQSEAIKRAVAAARIDPRTISYVEAHGTGTLLGDPIEVRGLTLAYGSQDAIDPSVALDPRCRIGSIKPNIGHLEAGAGVVGLIKVLLQLQRGTLLPSITSPQPNPQIPFSQTPFAVQTALEPWDRLQAVANGRPTTVPRRAGVNSFGVGGSNAHIILEEAPSTDVRADGPERPVHVMALSSASAEGLARQAASMHRFVSRMSDDAVADVCFSVNTGREAFEHRAAVSASSRGELEAHLFALSEGKTRPGVVTGTAQGKRKPTVAFLFTGQGSQYAGMGRQLYDTQPVFRDAIDRCAAIFDQTSGASLLETLFAADNSDAAARLNQTGFTQPALFAFEYALAQLWRSWGIEPDLVMGHSVGEIAAMCVAGGVSLEDGLQLIAARGRLMQALPSGGAMLSVMADEALVAGALAGLEDRVTIAAINGPRQVVISGAGTAVAGVGSKLEADGIKTKALVVSHAFHSPLMQPMLAEYDSVVRRIAFSVPRIPFVSCVDGAVLTEELTQPDYWRRQVIDPVRFAAGVHAAESRGIDVYVEVGPHPVLLGMARECVDEKAESRAWVPSLRRDVDPWTTLAAGAARLFTAGAPVDWRAFDRPYTRRRVSVPTYAFGGKKHWLRPSGAAAVVPTAAPAPDPKSPEALLYDVEWIAQPLASAAGRSDRRHWLVLGHDDARTVALLSALQASGDVVTRARSGDGDATLADGTYVVNPLVAEDVSRLIRDVHARQSVSDVLFAWALPAAQVEAQSADILTSGVVRDLLGLTHVVQALAATGVKAPVRMLTSGAVIVEGAAAAPIHAAGAPLWGFGRTLALEHPDLYGGLIDLDPAELGSPDDVVRELRSGTVEDQVAFRAGTRLVARVRRAVESGSRFSPDPDATYLVTGGVGAIGQHVARWLAAAGARHLVLTSRHGATDSTVAQAREALRAQGVEVVVTAADVSRDVDVARLMADIDRTPHPLRGVFHAAGVDVPMPLARLSQEALESVLKAKVAGTWLLDRATRGRRLDAFVVFSSVAAVLGSQNRAHYAAANAYLDAVVGVRHQLGLAGASISWGPWSGGGMASDEHLAQFERIGNRGLDPRTAVQVLDRVATRAGCRVAVADIDWTTFRAAYAARRERPLVSNLGTVAVDQAGQVAPPATSEASWTAEIARLAPQARLARLTELLGDEVADTLGFAGRDEVAVDRSWSDLGMDSLMMAEFVGRLKKRVGFSTAGMLFEQPELRALAPRLLAAIESHVGAAGQAAPLPQASSTTPAATGGASAEPLRIEGYDAARLDALVAFQERTFPDRRPDLIARRFEWMFLESAARVGVAPHVWLAVDGGAVVGQMGSIPVRVKMGSEVASSAWYVDTMVLGEYKSMALGTRLMVEAQQDVPFALSLGQTTEMRDIQFKLGWSQVAPLQTAQLLLRPERVLDGKLPTPVAWAAGIGLRASGAVRDMFVASRRLEARPVDRFGPAHDQVWDEMARDLGSAVVRDASYLNWKYVDQPGQAFHRVELVENGQVKAAAVWMLREPDAVYKYRRAFLVDLIVPPSDTSLVAHVVKMVCAAAGEAGADAVACLHVGDWLTAALKRCGFLLRAPERVLLVLPGAVPESARGQILKGSQWYITQGDSDLDRP